METYNKKDEQTIIVTRIESTEVSYTLDELTDKLARLQEDMVQKTAELEAVKSLIAKAKGLGIKEEELGVKEEE